MNELFTSLKRTPYQSLASFLILFFTLFLSLFFFNLNSFFNSILNYVETKPHVTVYFQKQTSEGDIFKIRDKVKDTGKVTSIEYISKEKALQIYKNLNRDDPLLLEMVSADILPPSLEIYTTKPTYLNEIADFLKKQTGVDDVVFQKDIVNKLLGVTNVLKRTSLFLLLFLVFISFIVLMTTTAFKITLKKQEIELLRLLGASTSYVRRPYLLEGSLFGVVAATIAFVLYYAVFFLLRPSLGRFFADIPTLSFYSLGDYGFHVWPPSLYYIALTYVIILLFGVVIGVVGNFLAASKYIK